MLRKKVRAGGLQVALAAAAPPAAAPIAPHRSPTPPPPKPPPTDAQPHRATPPYRPLHPPRRRQQPRRRQPSGPPYLRTPAHWGDLIGRKLMYPQHRLRGNCCAARPRADMAACLRSPLRNWPGRGTWPACMLSVSHSRASPKYLLRRTTPALPLPCPPTPLLRCSSLEQQRAKLPSHPI